MGNMNYKERDRGGESRWQNSSSELTAVHDDSPVFRGGHSPSMARTSLRKHPLPPPGPGKNRVDGSRSPKKKSGRNVANSVLSSSAHELRTNAELDILGAQGGKGSIKNKQSTKKQWSSSSNHDSSTRKTKPLNDGLPVPKSSNSGLFDGDSFMGTMPLGGMEETFEYKNNRNEEHSSGTAPTIVSRGPWSPSKQPIKSAMRRKRGDSFNKESSFSSISMPAAHDDPNPDRDSVTATMESSGSTMASLAPLVPTLSGSDNRWASNSPGQPAMPMSPAARAPVRPGRTVSEDSLSLSAGPPPLMDDSDDVVESNDEADSSVASGSSSVNGRIQLKTSEEKASSPENDNRTVAHAPKTSSSRPQTNNNVLAIPPSAGDLDLITSEHTAKTAPLAKVDASARRRGSTGALAQKWEQQFPHKTPILPSSAPTTPTNGARKRFNHRRRGSFGIYSNVVDDDHEAAQRKPTSMEMAKESGEDEYDLFLESGATGDFASWLEEQKREKDATAAISPTFPPQDSRPPRARRGSTGALAQRWEEELLPTLKSTIPPISPMQVAKRRESGSRRRSSMGALVEKWEQLLTPPVSPKKPIEMAGEPKIAIDLSSTEPPAENLIQTEGSLVATRGDVVVKEQHSPKINAAVSDVEQVYGVIGSMDINDEVPLPPLPKKQKRRGSTGTLEKKNKKSNEDGSAPTSPASVKRHKRRGSTGRMSESRSDKRIHVHREKTHKSLKTKALSEESRLEMGDGHASTSPTSEQSAGEASGEELSKRTIDMDILTLNPTPNQVKKKKKSSKLDDLDSSKRSCSSGTNKIKTKKPLVESPKSKIPKPKKHLPGSKVVDILKVSSSSESGTKKKKSQSIGNLKVKKKDGTSGRRKSQSDGIVISAADSARIKEKKMKSRDALGDDKKRRTSLNNAG